MQALSQVVLVGQLSVFWLSHAASNEQLLSEAKPSSDILAHDKYHIDLWLEPHSLQRMGRCGRYTKHWHLVFDTLNTNAYAKYH